MKIELMDSTKKKEFLSEVSYLNEGGFKMRELFLKAGSEQVRIYSGSLHAEDILKIWRNFPIEGVGLYFGKQIVDRHGGKEARLSLDGLHLIKNMIKKNIVELDSVQNDLWFKGNNVELNSEQKDRYKNIFGQFVAVKFGEDFVGTAKLSSQGILSSFLPKERRIRN